MGQIRTIWSARSAAASGGVDSVDKITSSGVGTHHCKLTSVDHIMWKNHSVMEIGRSSTRMVNAAQVGPEFALSSNNDASKSPMSSVQTSALSQPLVLKTLSSYTACILLICFTTYSSMAFAQDSFSVLSSSYKCSSNVICLGEAHVYTGNDGRIQAGRLSLLHEVNNDGDFPVGLAYYNQQVRLLDLSTRHSASFNSSFTVDNVWATSYLIAGTYGSGEGITFLISANNSYQGDDGERLGIFNSTWVAPYQSVVVEFDTYQNGEWPVYDISGNHVSLDLANITYVAAKNASDVSVNLAGNSTFYAWVEYGNETQQLEVRVSNVPSRPIAPLLNYTVDLFDVVQEYMLVGFSSSAHGRYSNFYIKDWTFESSLEAYTRPSPGPSPVPTAIWKDGKFGGDNLATILGISVSISIFLLVCIVIALFVQRMRGSRGGHGNWRMESLTFRKEDPKFIQIEGMPKTFSYKELSVATKAFSKQSKLGQGGFGSVYRGVLPSSGISVAVKKISGDSNQGEKEFMAEVSIISQLRHRNLIQLLGWCEEASKGKYLLVYELMPNGSLDQVLIRPAERRTASLSWAQRYSIVTGTAAALDYLHQGWTKRVIHGDIKSSNIMLDEDWNAKLGDFGLARLVDHESEASMTGVAGTSGYLAPEVAAFDRFTDKTDVFAFGAVVLEVACGRKALSFDVPEGEMVLADWVRENLSEGTLMRTVDRRLEDYDTYWMEVMLTVGLLCSHPDPASRPTMRHVVGVLAGDVPVPSIPPSKPAPVFSALRSSISTDCSQDTKGGSTHKSTSGSIPRGFNPRDHSEVI